MVNDTSARVRIIVTGRVQGVFFRRSAADQAGIVAVNGLARNLPDGSVEILAEGQRPNLEELVRWAHRGPSHARVDSVVVQWLQFHGEFKHFEVC